MRDSNKVIEIIEREGKDMKFNVLVRLTRDYNVAEVSSEDIENVDDLEYAKNFCRTQAESLLNSYDTTKKIVVPLDGYVKETAPNKWNKPQVDRAQVTAADITTKFASSGQKGVAVKRIQKGELTLAQVNAISSWDEMQSVIFG